MSNNKNKPCVLIDSNAWNFLHASGMDLSSSLFDRFEFAITIEILREMEAISTKDGKADLYKYFHLQIEGWGGERIYSGFFESQFGEDEQRSGGFGFSGFASDQECEFLEKDVHRIKPSRRGIYYGNEADLLIASRAGGNCYILTEDNNKSGPFKGIKNIIKVSQSTPLSETDFLNLLDSLIK